MKKISLLLLAALLLLVACGPAATPAPAQPTAAAPAAQAPAPTTPPVAPPPAQVQPTAVPPPQITEGGTFIEGSFADARAFNSIQTSDTTSARMVFLMSNGLLQVKRDLTPECDLCESFTVAPDNLKITFKLRKGVKFHDGKELTAKDVKFTYDSILDPDKASVRRGELKDFFTSPDSIKVIDDYTVEFNFAKVKADVLVSNFGYGVLPMHILGEAKGKAFTDHEFNTKKPVYTGPFMFKEWVKDDHITLVANPNYFKGKPKLGTYILKIVPDSTALFAQLKTGEIDWGGIDPAQAAEAKKLTNINTEAFDVFGFTFYAYQLDPTTPSKTEFFVDKRVRQALLLAIDRKAIVDSQLFGYGIVANTVMPPISWAYNKDNKPTYGYDPAQAKKLLDEAGWKPGPDGIRVKDGKRMSFTLWTNAGNKIREAIIVAMQQFWKEVGVEAKTATEEWNAYLKRIGATPDGTRDFDVFLVGFAWGVDPNQKTMWHSGSITGGFNMNKYSNKEVDQLLDDALNTLDQAKRKELYFKVQAILAEEVPSAILFFSQSIVGYTKRLNGYKPSAAGSWNNIHEMWMAPKTQ
jgi:peptide/nickel transport system substrate-binding protein